MNTEPRCKVSEWAQTAAALGVELCELDIVQVKSKRDTDEWEAAQRRIEAIVLEHETIDEKASRRYVNSVLGLAFQIGVMHRAIDVLRSSKLSDDKRRQIFTRIDKAYESIMQYLRQGPLIDARALDPRRARASGEGGGENGDKLDVIRRSVSAALAKSNTWDEVQAALAESDLEYFERGGGLAIRSKSTGEVLSKGSQAGPGYLALIKKFGAPFPGHSAEWLAEKALSDC